MIGPRRLLRTLLLLGLFGNLIFFLGQINYLKPYLILPLSLVLIIYACIKNIDLRRFKNHHFTRGETFIFGLITTQLLVNAFGLFIPDTSFDALWYHLPEALVYARTGIIRPIPELLYSTMPRLGEMYFIPGFMLNSLFLVRFISFSFALLLLVLTYHLARIWFNRFISLLIVAIVNSVFVIAWQSTAGYVDLIRAVFETGSLLAFILFLKTRRLNLLLLTGTLLAFALSIKFQAIMALIATIGFLLTTLIANHRKPLSVIRNSLFVLVPALLIASPWYLINWHQSGHPFFPTNLPEKQLDQLTHAGAASTIDWLSQQTLRLPLIFWDLSFDRTRWLTPIIFLLLPFLPLTDRRYFKNYYPYIFYAFCFILIWWYLPPPENRYLLGVIPLFTILLLLPLKHLPHPLTPLQTISYYFILMFIGINLIVRITASLKYLSVIAGFQSPESYLNSQTTDFNRSIIEKFYSGYWHKYRYP